MAEQWTTFRIIFNTEAIKTRFPAPNGISQGLSLLLHLRDSFEQASPLFKQLGGEIAVDNFSQEEDGVSHFDLKIGPQGMAALRYLTVIATGRGLPVTEDKTASIRLVNDISHGKPLPPLVSMAKIGLFLNQSRMGILPPELESAPTPPPGT